MPHLTDRLADARMMPIYGCNELPGFLMSSLEPGFRGSFFLYMHEIRYKYASEY